MVVALENDVRIKIYGTAKEIDAAKQALATNDCDLSTLDEPMARLAIQSIIDEYKLKASILINGNSVWSKTRVIQDIRRVMRYGMTGMTDYLYKFLHLCCGSIAHYNKAGWIAQYPEISDLRNFFRINEFNEPVSSHIPHWKTDVALIVSEIEELLDI